MSATRHIETSNRVSPTGKIVGLGAALVVSAYSMSVAIQSPHGWWLGWITLVPLLLAIRVLPPLQASVAGSLWGVCFYVLSQITGEPPFAHTFGSFALLSTVPGLYAGAGSFVTRRAGFSPLLLGLGWVGVEFALHPLGLYHGLLAGTQGNGLVVHAVGSLTGYVLVAFLVAYVSAALLSALSDAYVRVTTSRFVSGLSGAPPRFVPFELPCDLLHFLRPSQPRGPPA